MCFPEITSASSWLEVLTEAKDLTGYFIGPYIIGGLMVVRENAGFSVATKSHAAFSAITFDTA